MEMGKGEKTRLHFRHNHFFLEIKVDTGFPKIQTFGMTTEVREAVHGCY
jgi:hypothetical protein